MSAILKVLASGRNILLGRETGEGTAYYIRQNKDAYLGPGKTLKITEAEAIEFFRVVLTSFFQTQFCPRSLGEEKLIKDALQMFVSSQEGYFIRNNKGGPLIIHLSCI
jgi:hypothetical protein